jgi:hypothetical protein
MCDETIVTETPPLSRCWGKIGSRVEVPITGNRGKRIVYGTLNIKTGTLVLDQSARWTKEEFQAHLRKISGTWRGWNIVLFLDRGSPHRALATREAARKLGIELRLLPVASPELNAVDHLWQPLKTEILSNEPTPHVATSVERGMNWLRSLRPREILRKAGCLSENFWLKSAAARV